MVLFNIPSKNTKVELDWYHVIVTPPSHDGMGLSYITHANNHDLQEDITDYCRVPFNLLGNCFATPLEMCKTFLWLESVKIQVNNYPCARFALISGHPVVCNFCTKKYVHLDKCLYCVCAQNQMLSG